MSCGIESLYQWGGEIFDDRVKEIFNEQTENNASICLGATRRMWLRDGKVIGTEGIEIEIERGSPNYELVRIQVLISSESATNAEQITENLPKQNETKIFTLTNQESGMNYAEADKVQIAPVILVDGEEKACDIANKFEAF